MGGTDSNCYLCNSKCKKYQSSDGTAEIFDCPYCGHYQVSYLLLSIFENEYIDKKHLIAGFLGEINKSNHTKPYELNSDSVKNILSDARIPKTIMQKLEKFLFHCYLEYEFIGQEFAISVLGLRTSYGLTRKLIIGDLARENISYMKMTELTGAIKAMKELGWLNASINNVNMLIDFSFTARGLDFAEQIAQGNINSNKVFVAIEYHGDYQDRMKSAIKPACEACGFDAFIASDTEHNNNINDEMIVDIKRSKFIISDFTNNNEGAYYEAGYAEGMGLPVIKCCHQDWVDKLHFDVNHDKFIVYSDFSDYKDQLKKRIRATIAGAVLEDSE